MLQAGLALLAAVGYAFANTLAQVGLHDRRTTPTRALLINLVGGSVALLVALLVIPTQLALSLDPWGVLFFAGAGLAAALVGQGTNFLAIERIGSTRTVSLLLAENLFATFLAYLALGQRVTLVTGLGVCLLAGSTALFVQETGASRRPRPDSAVTSRRSPAAVGVAYALLGALFFAVAGVFRQRGVEVLPSALLGALIGNVVALMVLAGVFAGRGCVGACFRVGRRNLLVLSLSGVATGVGSAAFILALQVGRSVAITTGLKNTQPLFVFGLAALLLGRKERLSLRLALLVLLIVAGGVLTAAGRA